MYMHMCPCAALLKGTQTEKKQNQKTKTLLTPPGKQYDEIMLTLATKVPSKVYMIPGLGKQYRGGGGEVTLLLQAI